jgi:putative Flp pilus-assembly TadE/G-like protein
MTSPSNERGQAFVLTVVLMTVLLGMTALVLDVGSWFRTKRQLQATADAAALAGAQALPDDPGTAQTWALDYANKNGGGVLGNDVTISGVNGPNDTIGVVARRTSPGFFSSIFGVDSVDEKASAKARVGLPEAARYVAPIVVNSLNPQLQCDPPPCSGPADITLMDLHQPGSGNAAGAFALLDLIKGDNGSVGDNTMAAWMANGYNALMPLGDYDSVPSVMYNGHDFSQALQNQAGSGHIILFPVYDGSIPIPIKGGGSTAKFDIIGWVGFRIDSVDAHGNSGVLHGEFVSYLGHGLLPASGGNGSTNFGYRVIQLIE